MLTNRRHQAQGRFAFLPDTDRYVSGKPDPSLKINQIGTGTNGLEHIRVAEFEGRARVNGMYDPNPRSVEAARGLLQQIDPGREPVVYPDLASACTDPEVDALIVSTPNFTHLEVLRTAVEGGKHILLEKPMATTVSDAQEILDISRRYPAVLQIGLQYRYKSIYQESIAEALVNGSVGDIKTISIREHRIPFLDKVNQWNKFCEYSGGTLVEKCCHYFDLMNLFARSRPRRVLASGGQAVNFLDFEYKGRKSDIMDHAFVIVEYLNGVRASLDLNMFVPLFNEEMVLCGTGGWLRACEQQNFLAADGLECSMELYRGENHPARVCSPHYPKHIEAAGHHGSTFFEQVDFIDNILGKQTHAATVEEGFWSIVLGCAAEISVREERPVLVSELTQLEK